MTMVSRFVKDICFAVLGCVVFLAQTSNAKAGAIGVPATAPLAADSVSVPVELDSTLAILETITSLNPETGASVIGTSAFSIKSTAITTGSTAIVTVTGSGSTLNFTTPENVSDLFDNQILNFTVSASMDMIAEDFTYAFTLLYNDTPPPKVSLISAATIPEPSTLLLLISGIIGLALVFPIQIERIL